MSQLTILSGNEIVLKCPLIHNTQEFAPGDILTIKNVYYDPRFAVSRDYAGVVFDTEEIAAIGTKGLFPVERNDIFEDRYPLSDRTIEEWPVD